MIVKLIEISSLVLSAVLTIHGLYNLVIALFGFKKCRTYASAAEKHRFCAVIAARNEERVIGDLIKSLKEQNYPADKLDICVVANSCSDNTCSISLACGAKVYQCTGNIKSKGDALKEFFGTQDTDLYDAFCIFDADNVVDANFMLYMNDALSAGVDLAQGFRESKNPSNSWISGCTSIYFWIINRFINHSRQSIGLSAYLLGTGFMISTELLKEIGMNTSTLTEDLELSIQGILKGVKVAYVEKAITYDEHPNDFITSWKQRKRWSTGMMQCSKKYTLPLLKSIFTNRSLSCADAFLYSATAFMQLLILISALLSMVSAALTFHNPVRLLFLPVMMSVFGILISAVFSAFIVKLEKRALKDTGFTTIFLFWLFLLSWLIINTVCVFKPETVWKPIKHMGKQRD